METPRRGDKILILKVSWLHMILRRQKKLEIRGAAYKPGKYYIGHKHPEGKNRVDSSFSNVFKLGLWPSRKLIYGAVQLGEPMPITTIDEWNRLREQHRDDSQKLPYRRTFGLPILSVRPSSHRVPFTHPKGAIGIVRYR